MVAMEDRHRGLVARATRGDAAAIEDLLVRHLPALRAFVRLRTGPDVRARESNSDLVQSVCREVLAEIAHFEYRGESAFRHYLFTAALRKILDRGRSVAAARRHGMAAADGAEPDLVLQYSRSFSPSRRLIAREDAERLEAAFDALPDDQREVVVLSRVVGLSFAEIAGFMNRSENAVQKLHARALARVLTLLSPLDGDRRAPP